MPSVPERQEKKAQEYKSEGRKNKKKTKVKEGKTIEQNKKNKKKLHNTYK